MKQAAGIYTRFIVVIPYFKTETYHGLMRDRLKELPFELTKMQIPFYVLSEDEEPFEVYKQEAEVTLEKPGNEPYEQVLCTSFHQFFEKENLLVKTRSQSRGAAPSL